MTPHIGMNMAMSVDGKISSVAGESSSFTSREDKRMMQRIRSRCDALVVGADTAKDYVSMGIASERLRMARLRRGQSEQPIRVIVSGRLNLSPHLRAFDFKETPLVIACSGRAPKHRIKFFSKKARVLCCGSDQVNIKKLVETLQEEYKVNRILCEGGPTLNDSFFRSGMVDELFITVCPRVVGGALALTVSEGQGVPFLAQAACGHLISIKKGESEWFLRFKFDRTSS